MARLSFRILFDGTPPVGPGKVRLLELVRETGSIAAAGRAMAMSYRRAWLLVDELNRAFKQPCVTTAVGGKDGGGAALTSFGADLVARYRDMETVAHAALRPHLEMLQDSAAEVTAEAGEVRAGPAE